MTALDYVIALSLLKCEEKNMPVHMPVLEHASTTMRIEISSRSCVFRGREFRFGADS